MYEDRYSEILKEAKLRGFDGIRDYYIGVLLSHLSEKEIKKAEYFVLRKIKENYPMLPAPEVTNGESR